MVLPAQVINREPVAQGMLLDGRRFTISNMQYSAPIRGLGDKSVVIDIDAANGLPQEGIGFRSVEDATEYLQSTDVREYQTFDEFGNETVVKRQGMGIPDGLIKQLQEQNPEPQQTQQTNPQSTATTPVESAPSGSNVRQPDVAFFERSPGDYNDQDQNTETQQNTESSNIQGGPAENF